MDEGAAVAWPERFNVDELSAIQHAMNLLFRNEPAFMAEMQNDPRAAGDRRRANAIERRDRPQGERPHGRRRAQQLQPRYSFYAMSMIRFCSTPSARGKTI